MPSIIMPKDALSVKGGPLALCFQYSIFAITCEVGEKSSKRNIDNLVPVVDSTPDQGALKFACIRADSLNGEIQNPHAQTLKHTHTQADTGPTLKRHECACRNVYLRPPRLCTVHASRVKIRTQLRAVQGHDSFSP